MVLLFYRRSYRSSQLQHKRSLFRIDYAYRVRRFSRKPVFLNFKMRYAVYGCCSDNQVKSFSNDIKFFFFPKDNVVKKLWVIS
jgi:hypothetical protein